MKHDFIRNVAIFFSNHYVVLCIFHANYSFLPEKLPKLKLLNKLFELSAIRYSQGKKKTSKYQMEFAMVHNEKCIGPEFKERSGSEQIHEL